VDESRARDLLLAERTEVTSLLREVEEEEREAFAETSVEGARDYGDAALPLNELGDDDAVAEDLRERLAAIDRALARLEAGTYGRSVVSGQPIPDERLEADPAAELTIEEARAQR
jgi:DnaK suppressor protein